jgi:hypothetical protein
MSKATSGKLRIVESAARISAAISRKLWIVEMLKVVQANCCEFNTGPQRNLPAWRWIASRRSQ